jgi:hypothetical protein
VNGKVGNEGGALIDIGTIRKRRMLMQEVPRAPKFDTATGEPVLKPSGRQEYAQSTASMFAVAQAGLLGKDSAAVVTGSKYFLEHILEAAKETYGLARSGARMVKIRPVGYGADRMRAVTGKEPEQTGLGPLLGTFGKAMRVADAFVQQLWDDDLRALGPV